MKLGCLVLFFVFLKIPFLNHSCSQMVPCFVLPSSVYLVPLCSPHMHPVYHEDIHTHATEHTHRLYTVHICLKDVAFYMAGIVCVVFFRLCVAESTDHDFHTFRGRWSISWFETLAGGNRYSQKRHYLTLPLRRVLFQISGNPILPEALLLTWLHNIQ